MSKFQHILRILSLSLLICFNALIATPIHEIKAQEVTPDTIVELEDVVVLNYTLWVDSIIDDIQNGTVYVHDPADSTVPADLYDRYPDIHTPPNLGFMEELIGMRAKETKTVTIPSYSPKGFTNISDRLYGEELFYRIYLQKILVDASIPPFTLFDIPFFLPLMGGLILIVTVLLYFRIRRFTSTHDLLGRKNRCLSCGTLAEVICGNSGCISSYCKQCFIDNNGCSICKSNTMIPMKR